jgi:uncharacterized protein (TIGR02271 family)
MKHTIAAVFENRSSAQAALDDLLASGFSRQDARLSEDSSTAATSATGTGTVAAADDHSITSNIKHFFADIFGSDDHERARVYSTAVTRGHYVLTVNADSDAEVERASDIIEGYDPVDIDDKAAEWGSSLAGQDGLRTGLGSRLDSSSPSLQSQYASSGLQSTSDDALLQTSQTSLQGSAYQGAQQRATDTSAAIPVVQEELKVGKREVQRGGVRIYSRLVETPVNETIGLREEHVNVERHPVDRPVSLADADAFQEKSYELREMAEEAVVEKSARIVEEVVVGKEVSQRQENISDTVRSTEVEVEQLGGLSGTASTAGDDTYYRNHWTSNYAQDGGLYDDYDPAYRYGSSMAGSDLYRGRPWNEVEPTLRSDWETKYPGSTWEKMKAAVRHGWERITS